MKTRAGKSYDHDCNVVFRSAVRVFEECSGRLQMANLVIVKSSFSVFGTLATHHLLLRITHYIDNCCYFIDIRLTTSDVVART